MMRSHGRLLGTFVLIVATTACNASSASAKTRCPLPEFGPGESYHPAFDAKSFTPNVDNPLFPLTPGTTLVYSGTKDGEKATNVFAITAKTRKIEGVTTRVIEDRLFLNGLLEEKTADYYAQDKCGNVWYFGEDTATVDHNGNVVDTAGTWHAGVDGAEPGVFMQAHPELARRFRQEWYKGQAEDTFRAIDLSASVTVPYGSFDHALRTEETTELEPRVLDNKYYVRGIGEVLEKSVRGPKEALRLVDVIR